MGKKRQSESPGFLDKLFRTWKTQRVTLSQPDSSTAPMRKGKPVRKAAAKETKKAKKTELRIPTRKERQVNELKTMYGIGKRDPERLVQIISSMLQEAMMQEEEERLRFEQLLWDKVDKKKGTKNGESEDGTSG